MSDPQPQPEPVSLLAAMRSLQAALDTFDRDAANVLGLGRNDARALLYLAEVGEATPGQVCAQLGLTSGSVTALIDRLERAGYARRRPHGRDRRVIVVEPTEAGGQALKAASAPLSNLTTKLSDRLQHERSGAVVRQLDDLTRMVDWAGRSVEPGS